MVDNQIMQDILADKEMIDDKLQADNEINDAMDLLQQLKMEHLQEPDNQTEKMEKWIAKDDELKEKLILKQNSFDAAVIRHSYELEQCQKMTLEQSDKVLTLQKEVEEKEKELAVTRKEISGLHHDITQQADLLSAEKQTMKHELADKEQIIDKLEADIVMYKVELNDTKDLLSQLKVEWSVMKQKLVDNEKDGRKDKS